MLGTDEVARRLGVKPATVYAYVSRGLLRSERNADGKSSLFAEADVEAFAAGRRRTAPPADAPAIHTGLTLITDGGLFYRGHDARVLARDHTYESVVALLWTGRLQHLPLQPSPELLVLARAVTAPLPPAARLTDRLRVVVAAAAAADPLRFDTAPAAVLATGRTVLATMVEALPFAGPSPGPLPPAGATGEERFPIAATLWPRLTPAPPTAAGTAALNAALVLLADHDLAASTLAARVAASTRAHPYAVVGAGLAALDGPLHGAAGGLALALLTDALRSGDPLRAISERLRVGGVLPGFGHPLHPDGDPRAAVLLALLHETPEAATGAAVRGGFRGADVLAVVDEVAAAVTHRSGVAPNVDFALAALALLHGMDADAGETVFAVARTAGWIAHALEEYGDRPSRFRPSGRYAGRIPTAEAGLPGHAKAP
jgi:citrate synthase